MDPAAPAPVASQQDELDSKVAEETQVETSEESKVETPSVVISAKTGKPKRVLTEAQRLAFMKGREKRMANLEKRRQEKLEAQQFDSAKETVPPPPPGFEAADAIPLAEQVAAMVIERLKTTETPPAKKPRVKREKKPVVRVKIEPEEPLQESAPEVPEIPKLPSRANNHTVFNWL